MKKQFCPYCGTKLDERARFCKNCGEAIHGDAQEAHRTSDEQSNPTERKTVYEGYIHKCPNCGEVLNAFEMNCPTCGYELRDTKASGAVREFELKLEAIESKREYEKPGLFAAAEAQQRISKTDEQKISLIKNFSVPNSKEDMLEFMILATSNINMNAYDSANTAATKVEKEISAAWFSKVQQVYEKAKRSYSTDDTFTEIKELYDQCNTNINKAKKKGIIKQVLIFLGWIPILFIVVFILGVTEPKAEKEEIARLENIVVEVQQAFAQHKATQTANIGAFQVEKQAEVGVAGAAALGQMGANGAGDVNIGGGGDGTGFNMASMMASMAVGGAVGQNIAGTMNHLMGGIQQPVQSGMTPPPIPTAVYHVAVNGQATGPFDVAVLAQMTSAGQFTADSLVWKSGMTQWKKAGEVDELKSLFPAVPPIPSSAAVK